MDTERLLLRANYDRERSIGSLRRCRRRRRRCVGQRVAQLANAPRVELRVESEVLQKELGDTLFVEHHRHAVQTPHIGHADHAVRRHVAEGAELLAH